MKIFPHLFLYSDEYEILSNTKTAKILQWKVIKTRWFRYLASVTLKTTSKPKQPQNPPSGSIFKLCFLNQWLPLIKMSYRLSYLENFNFSNFQHPASEAANKLLNPLDHYGVVLSSTNSGIVDTERNEMTLRRRQRLACRRKLSWIILRHIHTRMNGCFICTFSSLFYILFTFNYLELK